MINENKDQGDKRHKKFKESLEKTLEGIYAWCNEVEETSFSNKQEIRTLCDELETKISDLNKDVWIQNEKLLASAQTSKDAL